MLSLFKWWKIAVKINNKFLNITQAFIPLVKISNKFTLIAMNQFATTANKFHIGELFSIQLHTYFINILSQLSTGISFMYRNICHLPAQHEIQYPKCRLARSNDFQTIEPVEQKSTFIKFEIFKEFWQYKWLVWCFRFYAHWK